MISCILLSAGESARFGSPKSLAQLNGKTVLTHITQQLLKTKVDEIIIVLGSASDQIKPCLLNHKKVQSVYNKDYKLGQTSSFKAGLKKISSQSKGIMLLPIDYPAIKASTIDDMINYFLNINPMILIPTFQERKGHPPIYHGQLKAEFLAWNDALGINTIARRHSKNTILFPVDDPGVITTFNTPEEFKKVVDYFEK